MKGTINNIYVEVALEPDGKGSHWFQVSDTILSLVKTGVGDIVSISLELMDVWNEPEIPSDFFHAIVESEQLNQWNDLTTKARWEWLRWMRSTDNPDTRKKRIKKACSMLSSGKRRPCCFNSSMCTDPSVSKTGVLLIVE